MKYAFLAFLLGFLFNYGATQVGTYMKYSAAKEHCLFTPVGAMCDNQKLEADPKWTAGSVLADRYPLWKDFVDAGQD